MTTSKRPPRAIRRQLNRAARLNEATTPDAQLAYAFDMARAAMARAVRRSETSLAARAAAEVAGVLVQVAERLDENTTPRTVTRNG